MGTDVPFRLAHEAGRVRQASVGLLRFRAHPEGVLTGATVEAYAGVGLHEQWEKRWATKKR